MLVKITKFSKFVKINEKKNTNGMCLPKQHLVVKEEIQQLKLKEEGFKMEQNRNHYRRYS